MRLLVVACLMEFLHEHHVIRDEVHEFLPGITCLNVGEVSLCIVLILVDSFSC